MDEVMFEPFDETIVDAEATRAAAALLTGVNVRVVLCPDNGTRYEMLLALFADVDNGPRLSVVLPDYRSGFAFTVGQTFCSWDYLAEKMRWTNRSDSEVVARFVTTLRKTLKDAR